MIKITVCNVGGFIFLWEDNLELDEIASTEQEIHDMIKVSGSGDQWLFSSIYARILEYA